MPPLLANDRMSAGIVRHCVSLPILCIAAATCRGSTTRSSRDPRRETAGESTSPYLQAHEGQSIG